jgi:hypothetical protein
MMTLMLSVLDEVVDGMSISFAGVSEHSKHCKRWLNAQQVGGGPLAACQRLSHSHASFHL